MCSEDYSSHTETEHRTGSAVLNTSVYINMFMLSKHFTSVGDADRDTLRDITVVIYNWNIIDDALNAK